jgi:methionyl-tRNA formyltransferase
VVWAWCAAGHNVAEIWTDANPKHDGIWKRDRRLARLAARWSLTAAIKGNRIAHRRIESLKDTAKFVELIESLNVDVVLSVHFAKILPASLLSRLSVPVLNLHPTLLPAYRGATPLVAMVVDDAQDRFSGVTIHRIVSAIDAGPIFASSKVLFPKNKNLRNWELDLARAGSELVLAAVPQIVNGELAGIEQSEDAAIYRNTTVDDLKVNPAQSAAKVARLCEIIGPARPIVIDVGGRGYPVTQISKKLGPPTGEPPSVGWLYIDADVADARVRLRRKPSWEGRKRRIETKLLYMLSR